MVKCLTHNPKNEVLNPAASIGREIIVWFSVDIQQQPNGKALNS
jgi:hypothetical protein